MGWPGLGALATILAMTAAPAAGQETHGEPPARTVAAAGQQTEGDPPGRAVAPANSKAPRETAASGARLQAFGVWLAHAGSSVDASYGHSPGWSVTIAGVRASWRLAGSERLTVLYTMDVIPAAKLSPSAEDRPAICGRGRVCLPTRATAFGVGASPLGLHLGYRAHPAIQLHGGFTAGGMWFTERVPVTTASRMNFTVDLGAGVSLVRRGGMGVTLGYRVHHISNGWTAQSNPGIGAHMVTLGFDWGR